MPAETPTSNGTEQAPGSTSRLPVIAHFDLDAFFAAVEQYDKPSLAGLPVVVGGIGPRGVVATASYEARAFGVHSALAMAQARMRAPGAMFLPPRIARYRQRSRAFRAVLEAESDLVESLGMDEAYCDLSHSHTWDDPEGIAATITAMRSEIEAVVHAPVSAGVSTSKLVAKLATSAAKPSGQQLVAPGEELELVLALPVSDLPGVGPATAAKLAGMGIVSVTALAELPRETLISHFKPAHGARLYDLAHARDTSPVVPDSANKSLHAEHTFEGDLVNRTELHDALDPLVTTVVGRLVSHPQAATGVTLKIRRADFTSVTRSAASKHPLVGDVEVREMAHQLLDAYLSSAAHSGGIRLLGVAVTGLSDTYQIAFEFGSRGATSAAVAPKLEVKDELALTVGSHVTHTTFGEGWVDRVAEGAVAIRFEGPGTEVGRRRVFELPRARKYLSAAVLRD